MTGLREALLEPLLRGGDRATVTPERDGPR
jgi:hypothetical protein